MNSKSTIYNMIHSGRGGQVIFWLASEWAATYHFRNMFMISTVCVFYQEFNHHNIVNCGFK